MRRNTLFKPPDSFTGRIADIKSEEDLGLEKAQMLLQVELVFALLQQLRLDDEPVSCAWALLSGTPIRHPRLLSLTEDERRAIANTRQIVPFAARFAWFNALRDYQEIPERWRNYDLEISEEEDFEKLILNGKKVERQRYHLSLYENCLSDFLEFEERQYEAVTVGATYQFKISGSDDSIKVSFTEEQLNKRVSFEALGSPCAVSAFKLSVDDLAEDADFLDTRDSVLARYYGWDNSRLGNWKLRLSKIDFRLAQSDGSLSSISGEPLTIDGFCHIAGMVASGKTTLITLLAVRILRLHPEMRITIVVGDVQSAVKLANQLNWAFCDDPESDDPVAVPLLGRSQRDKQLKNFVISRDYLQHCEHDQPHWGERWLGTACPLQGNVSQGEIDRYPDSLPLRPGTEPCHSLKLVDEWRSPWHLCPFFSFCPSQQLYRDMPNARIWVATPGALSSGSLPRQMEKRPLKIGEVVYEQSHIVIPDEVETLTQWFDNVYAERVPLVNSEDGVFDTISTATEEYVRKHRVMSSVTSRWTGAQRSAQTATTAILTSLDEQQGHQILRDWISRSYFTPRILLYRLARRLIGLEEFDARETQEDERKRNAVAAQAAFTHFGALLRGDLLTVGEQTHPEVAQLISILQSINNAGESASSRRIHRACKNWIETTFPDVEDKLQQLKVSIQDREQQTKSRNSSQKVKPEDKVDSLSTLAYRLQFALTTSLLDYHTRIVFYEWQYAPPNIDSDPPRHRMPAAMLNILPVPAAGRQFGTYYAQAQLAGSRDRRQDTLTLFAYTNIGRSYILNFHKLLTDLTGRRGPNVLALSGTSYLPHSTRFHISSEVKGVLVPEEKAMNAISSSAFAFLPQYRNGQPIRISGSPEDQKMGLFKDMAKALAGQAGTGRLGQMLAELERLGKDEDEKVLWRDRKRILLFVNSYEQSYWAASALHQSWPALRGKIYCLKRATLDTDNHFFDSEMDSEDSIKFLLRTDIESFAQTGGQVLVAPLNAVGRGFNILNSYNSAAFGAVYFLTRPYPHPHDTQAIAQEMNRRILEWTEDEDFVAWQQDGINERAKKLRETATHYWKNVEQRSYYKTLYDDDDDNHEVEKLGAFPRKDLAATTVGLVIQAVGRLLRGGVPFKAFFVDAAWAPKSALRIMQEEEIIPPILDTEKTSLLVAMILVITDYAKISNTVGYYLYKPLAEALEETHDLYW